MRLHFGAAGLLSAFALGSPGLTQNMLKGPPSRTQANFGPATPAPSPHESKAGRAALFAMDVPAGERPVTAGARAMLFGGWQPNERLKIGVGLFRIPRSATANPRESRIDPLKDPAGKTSRIAAVGMSFRF